MKKNTKKQTEIYVRLIFGGKQPSQQVFIGLMLDKARSNHKLGIESISPTQYNRGKVFSDERVS